MVEIAVLVCTGLAFLMLVAAVPIEIAEERRDERPDVGLDATKH